MSETGKPHAEILDVIRNGDTLITYARINGRIERIAHTMRVLVPCTIAFPDGTVLTGQVNKSSLDKFTRDIPEGAVHELPPGWTPPDTVDLKPGMKADLPYGESITLPNAAKAVIDAMEGVAGGMKRFTAELSRVETRRQTQRESREALRSSRRFRDHQRLPS